MQKVAAKRLAKGAAADGYALPDVARCLAGVGPYGLGRGSRPLRGGRLGGATLSIGCIGAGRGGLRALPQHFRGDSRSNAEFAA